MTQAAITRKFDLGQEVFTVQTIEADAHFETIGPTRAQVRGWKCVEWVCKIMPSGLYYCLDACRNDFIRKDWEWFEDELFATAEEAENWIDESVKTVPKRVVRKP